MQYVKECLQLLYWMYFKPYTLTRYVQAICPNIYPYGDTIFTRSAAYEYLGFSAEDKANPNLQRYDNQCWWLTVLVPILATCVYAFLIEGISFLFVEPRISLFQWWLSMSFLLGWLIGLLLIRAVNKKIGETSTLLLVMATMALGSASLILSKKQFTSDSLIYEMAAGLIVGIMGGVSLNVVLSKFLVLMIGVIGGIAFFSVPLEWPFNIPFIVLIYAIFSIAFTTDSNWIEERLIIGMAVGTAIGIVVGVTNGVTFGVVGGVSYILGVVRFYFWLPELFWMFLLAFWPAKATAKLSWLPPQFDQVIVLPLPFLPELVAAAYQENQAAARQTINYLIFSTEQQKAARRAMALIATEECSRRRTAREIAALREQLAWLSEEPSTGLVACLKISQDVAAALEASSLYRQASKLDKVVQNIERQRNALATASAREATAFGSVLDSWQRILETACRTLREQAAQSDEVPQVYLAGPALDPNKAGPLFKGRRDLFRQIETLTLSSQHPTLVMHGGRRSGKTSTLNYLPKWLPSDILPLLIDGQSLATTSTLSGFAEEFADQIIRSARKVHSLKIPVLESVTQSADPFVTLRRWIDAVEQAVPDKTLLLCLDEFERLDEIVRTTDSRAPLNFLRHLIQHRDRWTLLFTGAQTPEELPAYWSDYLINCETLRVSYLAEADCLELIQRPVEDFPDIYPPAVAHAIRELTGGQPYFTQLLCHELVEQLNRKKEKIVQMDDLGTVLPAVFERGYQVFREFWETLTNEQRELLLAVAEEKTPGEEAMKAAAGLVRKEILAPEGGGWLFRVPLLCRWIMEGQGGLRSKEPRKGSTISAQGNTLSIHDGHDG